MQQLGYLASVEQQGTGSGPNESFKRSIFLGNCRLWSRVLIRGFPRGLDCVTMELVRGNGTEAEAGTIPDFWL